jgi:hypothetical protein
MRSIPRAPRRPVAASRSPRVVVAASTLAVCGALAALPLCGATALAQGTAPGTAPSGGSSRSSVSGRARRFARHREAFYVGGAAAGVAANAIWHYHAGSLVGQDVWLGRDKALHGGTAATLTFAGVRAGVRPWVAASTVCAAGGAFELTQLRASGKDAAVNCLGAATAWAWTTLVRRWRAGR